HAVVLRGAVESDGLGAPDRGRREILVDPAAEHDVVALQELLRRPELLVDAAQRRAAVAGDEAGGVEAGGLVAPALHHRQPRQRLGAGQIDAAFLALVPVVQRYGRQRHRTSLSHRLLPPASSLYLAAGCDKGHRCARQLLANTDGGTAVSYAPPRTTA